METKHNHLTGCASFKMLSSALATLHKMKKDFANLGDDNASNVVHQAIMRIQSDIENPNTDPEQPQKSLDASTRPEIVALSDI